MQEIRRKTRRQVSAEEKIRIVLEGLRGEESIATLCRKEGLVPNLYYRWSKEFLEAGQETARGQHESRGDIDRAYLAAYGLHQEAAMDLWPLRDEALVFRDAVR